jgi:hypothetical protein
MAKLGVGPGGIETMSGALAKPVKKQNHSHGNYLVTVHRKAATTNPICQRAYAFRADTYKRTTPLSGDETAARNRFIEVQAAVRTRARDLSKVSADQAAFLAQKDQAGGKKTMRAFLWKLEGDLYDQSHS